MARGTDIVGDVAIVADGMVILTDGFAIDCLFRIWLRYFRLSLLQVQVLLQEQVHVPCIRVGMFGFPLLDLLVLVQYTLYRTYLYSLELYYFLYREERRNSKHDLLYAARTLDYSEYNFSNHD
jgi:hypothetical protein